MQILHYLIVLILVSGEPVGVKFKDFDTFASEAKLKTQMNCDEFSNLKNRDAYIKKYFEIKESASFETICMKPDQFNEWIQSAKKYNEPPAEQSQNKENQIVNKYPIKDYTGVLRYKEPSTTKSLEAYSSTTFYLEQQSIPSLPVSSSTDVSYDILKKFVDKRVKITAKYVEEMPNPMESYPMEMGIDGKMKPITRKFHQILSIKAIK